MGVIIRQSLLNSLSSYSGLALGAVNTLILYPLAFMPENTAVYGLIQMILNYTLIISTFTAFGMPQVMVRFHQRVKEALHGELGFFGIIVPIAFLLPLGILLLVYREPLAFWLTENAEDGELLYTYLPLLVFTAAFNVYFEIFSSISQVHLRSVLPQFLKEVGRRLVATLLLLAFLLDWINTEQFIWLFCLMFPAQFVIMLFVLWRKGQLKLQRSLKGLPLRSMVDFGFFGFLTFGGELLLSRIDQLMIAKYINLENVVYYTIAFFIGNVINTPLRASLGISRPIVSAKIEREEYSELNSLFKRASLGLTLVAGWLFVGIVVSLEMIYELLPFEFGEGVEVTLLIASGKLISTTMGWNGIILNMSQRYRMAFWMNIGVIAATIGANLYFIPRFGVMGVALVALLVIVFNNSWKTFYLWKHFGLNPFSLQLGGVLLWMTAVAAGFFYWPLNVNPWWGIPVKSALASLIFLAPLYFLRVFPDFNALVNPILEKWRKRGAA